MYACMYECMYVCVYVCMYVCMYVCDRIVYTYVYTYVCVCDTCTHCAPTMPGFIHVTWSSTAREDNSEGLLLNSSGEEPCGVGSSSWKLIAASRSRIVCERERVRESVCV